MAGQTVGHLYMNLDLFEVFKKDPLQAISELEKRTNLTFGNLSISDIEIIKGLNIDELQLLASIYERTKDSDKPFKLG